MVRMLQPNPARRLTLSEVMAHPWFQQDLPPHLATLNDRLLQVRHLGQYQPDLLISRRLRAYVRRRKTCGLLFLDSVYECSDQVLTRWCAAGRSASVSEDTAYLMRADERCARR